MDRSTHSFIYVEITSDKNSFVKSPAELQMFELIDDEHDCYDFLNEDGRPTYVLSGCLQGINDSRANTLMNHLQESIIGRWQGEFVVTSNFKSITSYDYITEVESELEDYSKIQRTIEIAIEQFASVH